MDWLENARTSIARYMPNEGDGYNVVAVDGFEMPGEGLYLVGTYATREEAQVAAEAHHAKCGDKAYVYGPPRAKRRPPGAIR